MHNPASRFDLPSDCDDVPAPPLEIVVLYDNRGSFRRAMHVLASSLNERIDTSDVCLLPWRFAEMQIDPWRERALNDAADADVLVVSAAGDGVLSAIVVEWIVSSLTRRGGRSTKVMLVHGTDEDEPRYESSCSQLVRRMVAFPGVEFIGPERLTVSPTR
jgi:hypothetical protein